MTKNEKREDATPGFLYSVRDVIRQLHIGEFSRLTGGEMTNAMISYNLVYEFGGSVTRYFPGHTTYAPVKLTRAMDSSCKLIYANFMLSSAIIRTNFSITLIDHQGKDRIIWNLYNAIPTAISGFNFNQESGTTYADFEVTIQAERIELQFL